MNNPIGLMNAFRHPEQFLQNAMNNSQLMQNPMFQNAMQMYQKGDIEGVNKLAENLCKEKGTSVEEMKRQIKTQFGM